MKPVRMAVIAAFLLAAGTSLAQRSGGPGDPKKDPGAVIKRVLETPAAQVFTADVDEFLDIDPRSVPRQLRKAFGAKRLELQKLRLLGKTKARLTEGAPKKNRRCPYKHAVEIGPGVCGCAEPALKWLSLHTGNCFESSDCCETSYVGGVPCQRCD